MSHSQLEVVEKYLGKMPSTVSQCLTVEISSLNPSKCYLESLEHAIKKIPKTKMRRYYAVARVVFCLLASIYEIYGKTTLFQKIRFSAKKENELEKELKQLVNETIRTITKNITQETIPASMKEKNFYLNIYTSYFNRFKKKFTQLKRIDKSKVHFEKKIISKRHPLMSSYLIETGNLAFGSDFDIVSPIIITLESVIHGIDDYVDESKQAREKSVLDIANVTIGIFTILDYVLELQRNSLIEMINAMISPKNKPIQLLDLLKDCLLDLSKVPLVENETANIVSMANDANIELDMAIKNLETRTKGTTKTLFTPTYVYLNRDSDVLELERLIWVNRLQEMLEKDIRDINSDLKNKDYKGVAMLFKKYKRRRAEFRNQINMLNSFCMTKAFETLYKRNRYQTAKEYLGKKILENYKSIKRQSSKF